MRSFKFANNNNNKKDRLRYPKQLNYHYVINSYRVLISHLLRKRKPSSNPSCYIRFRWAYLFLLQFNNLSSFPIPGQLHTSISSSYAYFYILYCCKLLLILYNIVGFVFGGESRGDSCFVIGFSFSE